MIDAMAPFQTRIYLPWLTTLLGILGCVVIFATKDTQVCKLVQGGFLDSRNYCSCTSLHHTPLPIMILGVSFTSEFLNSKWEPFGCPGCVPTPFFCGQILVVFKFFFHFSCPICVKWSAGHHWRWAQWLFRGGGQMVVPRTHFLGYLGLFLGIGLGSHPSPHISF